MIWSVTRWLISIDYSNNLRYSTFKRCKAVSVFREPPSTPPPDEFGSKAGGEDEIITMKEYKKRERERDYRDHSPRLVC